MVQITLPHTPDPNIPTIWLENQTDVGRIWVIREIDGKRLKTFTIHIDDVGAGGSATTHPLSSRKDWAWGRPSQLRPDLLTPYKISISSLNTMTLEVRNI